MYRCTGMYNGWHIISELWCKLVYLKLLHLVCTMYCSVIALWAEWCVFSDQLLRKVELAKVQDRLMDESES